MQTEKLIVGTASFGQKYGVANTSTLSESEAADVVLECLKYDICAFDTATDYGEAENILGKFNKLSIYSKLSGSVNLGSWRAVLDSVGSSLDRLNSKTMSAISAHSSRALTCAGVDAVANFEKLKEMGIIHAWGVSVYDVEELEEIIKIGRPDFVQAPVNVLDKRFLMGSVPSLLSKNRIDLHARSIYLQGALLMAPESLPNFLRPLEPILRSLENISNEVGISSHSLLAQAVESEPTVARVVVGFNNPLHVSQYVSSSSNPKVTFSLDTYLLEQVTNELIDPRKWG